MKIGQMGHGIICLKGLFNKMAIANAK